MSIVPAWTVAISEHSAPGWVYVLDADQPDRFRLGEHSTALVAAMAPVRLTGGTEHGAQLVRRGTRAP